MKPSTTKGDADKSREVQRLRQMIAEGAAQAASGMFIDGEKVLAEVRRRREEHRRGVASKAARTLPP